MGLVRLRAVLSVGRIRKGLLIRSSFRSISSENSLIDRLIQEPISRIKSALDLEEAKKKSNSNLEFPWDSLLRSLHSSPQKAHLVLEWRLEKLLKQNERNCHCYSELIHLCGRNQNFQMAMRVFTSMENQGIKTTSAVLNALISACLSSGNVITALSLFEIMESSEDYKPDSDTYTAFISGFANLGNDKAMIAWYSAKLASDFSPDIQTYEAIITGCIKSKSFVDADRFFKELVAAGFIPNPPILHGMLSGYCEQRSLDRVREFLKFIIDLGWEIDRPMAEKLVGFYYELGMVEEMEELLVILTKTNQVAEVLSPVHNMIIQMYAMLDRLDDVEYSVGRMLKQGILFKCAVDVEKVICSYFRRATYDRLDLFLECIKVSHKLARSTYDLLIAGYRRAGLYENVDALIKDMKAAEVL